MFAAFNSAYVVNRRCQGRYEFKIEHKVTKVTKKK